MLADLITHGAVTGHSFPPHPFKLWIARVNIIVNPYDFFGQPVATGTVKNGKITVPLDGEFAAFVLLSANR